jgi:DNA primase
MSLPPGFLDELRTRLSLAQVAGRKVMWDSRKSNPGKGDYWAPCPFHQEKTASFHVDDRKGFYYCFGCHAKGDAIGFVKDTENVGFMEAVEILAREAGMPMPARDPAAQQKSDRNTRLAEVMEQAVQFYRLQLRTSAATDARDYLSRRKLDDAAQERFEIGFAPDTRTALWTHLTGKGVAPELIIAAGLAIEPEDKGTPFDRFRGRIMFPIRDQRGRAIAFGGRAMDPNARAKYLNSNETALFDKGRTLYNIGPAREAAGKSGALVVAEGYMDVIALVTAGFGHAVAPLGTAITEEQLRLMWRIAPEPVISLDSDKAGIRAAMRLVDLALPLLEPGKSLRFCILPEGLDPDDLLRQQGKAAMQAALDAAVPLVAMLWRRETEDKVFDSPERRAALDLALKSAIQKIADASVRAHYDAAIRDLRADFFRSLRKRPEMPGRGMTPRGRRAAQVQASEGAKASLLARAVADEAAERLRAEVILALALRYPALVPEFESDLERLRFPKDPGRAALRDAILHQSHTARPDEVLAAVSATVGADTIDTLFALKHVRNTPAIRKSADLDTARTALAEELARQAALAGSAAEIREAMSDMAGLVDEGLTWRLGQAAEARDRALKSALPEGGTEAEDRTAMSGYLQSLIDNQVWVKKKG